jgi:hypothetical protein
MRIPRSTVWFHATLFAGSACGGKSDPRLALASNGGGATSAAGGHLTGEAGATSGGSAGLRNSTGGGAGGSSAGDGRAGNGAGVVSTGGAFGAGGGAGNSNGVGAVGGTNVGGNGVGGATGGASVNDGRTGGTGGTSAGGAGGEGGARSCIDVCELHGPACCTEGIDCVAAGTGCVIEILSARVDTIYEYAELEAEILTLPPDLQLSLTDADFTRAAFGPAPAARIGFVLSPEAEAAYGEMLESPPYRHPFRLSCDGQPLFVGITYDLIGAAAIGTPVLHPVRTEEALELRLGAIQGAWLLSDLNVEVEARERIDRPELRAALCRRGIVEPLEAEDGSP